VFAIGPDLDDVRAVSSGLDYATILLYADVRSYSTNSARSAYILLTSPAFRMGQSLGDVAAGAGFYAHATRLDDHLVNIEYWTLYAMNKLTLAGELVGADHEADLTAVEIVVDERQDRVIRAAFSIHGTGIAVFDIPASESRRVTIPGYSIDGVPSGTNAVEYAVDAKSQYQAQPALNGLPSLSYSPSDNLVYFAIDSATGKGDHLAVFLEWGSHEAWPNRTGSWTGAPKHEGDSFAFTPLKVRVLNDDDGPFLYYGGVIGTDPVGVQRHRFWYDPKIDGAPQNDVSPYTSLGSLSWPPRQ
jgi:hypothetical protein